MKEYYLKLLLKKKFCKDCDKELSILNCIYCYSANLIIYDQNNIEVARYGDKLFEEYNISEKKNSFYEYNFKIQCFDNTEKNEFLQNIHYLNNDSSNYIIKDLDDSVILYHSIDTKTEKELWQEIKDYEFNSKGKLIFCGSFATIATSILYYLIKDPSIIAGIGFPISSFFSIKSGIIDQKSNLSRINHNKALIKRKRNDKSNK